jgi:hypothetical protein
MWQIMEFGTPGENAAIAIDFGSPSLLSLQLFQNN